MNESTVNVSVLVSFEMSVCKGKQVLLYKKNTLKSFKAIVWLST